jgi:hypothetical protein
MTAVAGNFGFFGTGLFTGLATVFFSGRRNANAGQMSAFIGLVRHDDLLGLRQRNLDALARLGVPVLGNYRKPSLDTSEGWREANSQ